MILSIFIIISDTSQPVMALLNGGGYSQYVAVHKNHIMSVPKNISLQNVIFKIQNNIMLGGGFTRSMAHCLLTISLNW